MTTIPDQTQPSIPRRGTETRYHLELPSTDGPLGWISRIVTASPFDKLAFSVVPSRDASVRRWPYCPTKAISPRVANAGEG